MQRAVLSGIAGGWLTASLAFGGGPFPPLNEGPVPFRRDRLPVDSDTMRSVAGELVALARGRNDETPEGRHSAAQLLALALALDPMNAGAKETLESFRDGPGSPTQKVEPAKPSERLGQLAAELGSSDAGKDARALAACLSDVLAAADSKSAPTARGDWHGWVPELAAYRSSPKSLTPNGPAAPQAPSIVRREGMISAPLWIHNDETRQEDLRQVAVSLKVPGNQAEKPQGFGFRLDSSSSLAVASLSKPVAEALAPLHGGKLPAATVGLHFDAGSYLESRGDPALSGVAAILMDAAITGREPTGTVIAKVEPNGNLTLPGQTAYRLLILGNGRGGRLMVPRAAEPLLSSMPVLTDPGFFLKYEVIFASNVRELTERATPKPSGVAGEAMAEFEEIRLKAGNTPVGAYVANRYIRQRLAEIVQKFPDHASARLLLQQGAGELPLKLPRPVLAAEIFRNIEPMRWILGSDFGSGDAKKLEQAQDACRKDIDRIERYVGSEDRVLLERYKDLLQALRGAIRTQRHDSGYGGDSLETRQLRVMFRAFRDDLVKSSE